MVPDIYLLPFLSCNSLFSLLRKPNNHDDDEDNDNDYIIIIIICKVRIKIMPVIFGALGRDQNLQLLPGHPSAIDLQMKTLL